MEPLNLTYLKEERFSLERHLVEGKSDGDPRFGLKNIFILDCIALKRAISSEFEDSGENLLDFEFESEITSPTKGISGDQTRDLEENSHFIQEDFDYPFNGKVILQDLKIFFLWVFIGYKTSRDQDQVINEKIQAIMLSWDQLKENSENPSKDVDENIVNACKHFVQIVKANASSALQQRILLYTGIALAIIGRMVQLESLQWIAGVVSLIALGTMGWSYTANLLNQSDLKRSLKRELDDYITDSKAVIGFLGAVRK